DVGLFDIRLLQEGCLWSTWSHANHQEGEGHQDPQQEDRLDQSAGYKLAHYRIRLPIGRHRNRGLLRGKSMAVDSSRDEENSFHKRVSASPLRTPSGELSWGKKCSLSGRASPTGSL